MGVHCCVYALLYVRAIHVCSASVSMHRWCMSMYDSVSSVCALYLRMAHCFCMWLRSIPASVFKFRLTQSSFTSSLLPTPLLSHTRRCKHSCSRPIHSYPPQPPPPSLNWGGSNMRPEATGFGAVYFASEMLVDSGDTLLGKRVAVSGSGNVALHCAEKLL